MTVPPVSRPLSIVILGLSVTSSWGNGHATTYRALMRALHRRGHRVLFLERDKPWYAANRDLPQPPFGTTRLYGGLSELDFRWRETVREADLVVVGSFVPEGVEVCRWVQRSAGGVTAFYDIDTPVTLAGLGGGTCEYLRPDLIPGFDLYLSFTGGPTLERLECEFGARRARPLYCSVDPENYYPSPVTPVWSLGYLGTYSADRQPTLGRLLVEPARRAPGSRFAVAGSRYPDDLAWPENVRRIDHLPPFEHRAFYNAQRFTLNVTRADMVAAGWSPSVRLFEAAACGVPIISDAWAGLDALLRPGEEIVVAGSGDEVLDALFGMTETERRRLGQAARRRVLAHHTADHRAAELEGYLAEVLDGGRDLAAAAGAVS